MSSSIQSILRKLGQDELARLQGLGQTLGMSGNGATGSSTAGARIEPIPRGGPLPLSFAQQRLWFLAQLEGVSATYHIPLSLRLHGPLDRDALQASLDRLFARHESLRTVFVAVDGKPHAQLLPPDSGLPLIVHDLRTDPEPSARLRDIAAEELHAPFDLARGPLIRARLLRLAEEEHELLITQHHIVSDGWSIAILARELGAIYSAIRQQRADALPPLSIQYPDYAAWQQQWLQGPRLQQQIDYWRRSLAGAPVLLDLPTDRPRPPQQSFAAACLPLRLDAQLSQALKRVSQAHGATLFMTVLAAWSAVLGRLSGQTDLLIGTPNANRNRAEIQPLIGFFVNTLALRIDLSGDPSLAELLARVRGAALAAQDHQDLPFERVVEALQPPRRLDHTPLFQVLFAWQNNEESVFELDGLHAQPPQMAIDTLKFDLELHLSETADGIGGTLYYSTALFDASTVERQLGYLLAVLKAMVADDGRAVAAVDLLAPAERNLLLHDFNSSAAPNAPDLCVHELFERQAQASPDAVAVVHRGRSLSYAQLDSLAERLARALVAQGVGPGRPVALCVERGIEMIVALVAILKAGGAYVPLDPAYPRERLLQILDDAGATVLIGDSAGREALGVLPPNGPALLDLDAFDLDTDASRSGASQTDDLDPRANGLTPDHLAYVIYTSGSTGVPKGVAMPHRPLINLLCWQNAQLPAAQTVLQFAALGFDVAFQEIFGALCSGGTLNLIDAQARLDFRGLPNALARERIQRLHLPYIALQSLAEASADLDDTQLAPLRAHLREIIVAGEQLRITPQIRRLFRRLPECRLHNHYGPTESHVVSAHTLAGEVDDWPDHVPIGRPIAHSRLYLLDGHGQPVPLGAVGELYIGGAGVARGYWNQPQLSAERFLTDPFAAEPGARMYRSGDLARCRSDGSLVFLGRNDHQVKIRGFRIELGEIEAQLTKVAGVSEAVVHAREDNPGDKRLVAYLVGSDLPQSADLRATLARELPEYMIPAAYVVLDRLPLTASGKLDRQALPAPDLDAFAQRTYEAPQGAVETALAQIWAELLQVEQVGRQDHFFELGGHSLLAVQLMERMRHQQLYADIRTLFAQPTLAVLAQAVEQARQRDWREVPVPPNLIPAGCTELTPDLLPLVALDAEQLARIVDTVPGGAGNIQDIYPLAPLQEGILFHH
ncbi:MAG: amino acid adenylation domain-containing protein, partial [Lysobacter sp.]